MFEEKELRKMSVTKYDQFGKPYQFNYGGRLEFEGREYAIFYPLEREAGLPIILRIEASRLVDISYSEEERRLLDTLEDWLEDLDQDEDEPLQ